VVVNAFEDCVTVTQWDARQGQMQQITLSLRQVRELGAALNLPEGIYRLADPVRR